MTEQDKVTQGGSRVASQRKAQMLRAALEVISERGFADTRIADIAERVGISPALVIYYFKTKDQLLTDAIRYYEDIWYAEGRRRVEDLPTAVSRLEEFVAMNLLPESRPSLGSVGLLWLDFWVQAARNANVASVRRNCDERWRDVLVSLIRAGQMAGEFAETDADSFAITLSALLDGLTVQITLEDPAVDPAGAFALCMRCAARHLGFEWESADPANQGSVSQSPMVVGSEAAK